MRGDPLPIRIVPRDVLLNDIRPSLIAAAGQHARRNRDLSQALKRSDSVSHFDEHLYTTISRAIPSVLLSLFCACNLPGGAAKMVVEDALYLFHRTILAGLFSLEQARLATFTG